jgi:leader peptidase (prepilin peptidase)/N-methyltransferase
LLVSDLPSWFWRAFAVAFGLVWGSFLNVVIHRVPRGESVVHPASRCICGKPIAPYDNVPVVSWLLLRGRARCCGARISARYPLVELIGGAVSLAILERIVFALPTDTSLARAGAIYGADFALCMGLVAAAFIDAEHMFLPDTVTIGGTVLGLATASFRDLPWTESLLGAALGFALVWLPFGVLYKRLRGRAGMGMGDAKLTMLAGAWFGWTGAAFVLLAGAVQGTIGALVILLIRGRIEEPEAVVADREALLKAAAEGDEDARHALEEDPLAQPQGEGIGQARLPFGPFLILAVLEYLFVGDRLVGWYASLLGAR